MSCRGGEDCHGPMTSSSSSSSSSSSDAAPVEERFRFARDMHTYVLSCPSALLSFLLLIFIPSLHLLPKYHCHLSHKSATTEANNVHPRRPGRVEDDQGHGGCPKPTGEELTQCLARCMPARHEAAQGEHARKPEPRDVQIHSQW